MQPDSQQAALEQLILIKQLLQPGQNVTLSPVNANSNGTGNPSGFVIAVNILWFISLTCSLGAAIGAMIIKQWLQFYTMGLSQNPFEYAHQHQHRYNALLDWHVFGIISSLPFVMLLSVGLFLVGLGLQLLQLHIGVATVVISFMSIVLLCYLLSVVLSVIYPTCPYKTSAMVLLKSMARHARSLSSSISSQNTSKKNHKSPIPSHHAPVNNVEINEIRAHQPQLVVNSITWLLGVSQQEEAIHNALLAIPQFHHTEDMVQRLLACNSMEQLVQRANVPLPALGHEFWKHLDQILPSHIMFLKLSTARTYMQILIAIWHHPSYLTHERPPAISLYSDLERQEANLEAKLQSVKLQQNDQENQQGVEIYKS